ncbi:MAG TPA: hypothetical protein VFT85_00575 [Acidimicrobiia bacterium]|nr:hypothetical protein [Acidimicrobiia bacterium]
MSAVEGDELHAAWRASRAGRWLSREESALRKLLGESSTDDA